MNWVRHADKNAIDKKEQDWFAKKESKGYFDKLFKLPSSSENLKTDVDPVKNLDIQRMFDFPGKPRGNKKGGITINKVNLDRTGTLKYRSVDMERNVSKKHPRVHHSNANDFGKCSNANFYGRNYISSPRKITNNYKRSHDHKVYNPVKGFQQNYEKTDDEKDQPFFLRYNDLRKLASSNSVSTFDAQKADVSTKFPENKTLRCEMANMKTMNQLTRKSIFDQQSDPCRNENPPRQINEINCCKHLDYFETPLFLTSKSSRIITFNKQTFVKKRMEYINDIKNKMPDSCSNGLISANNFFKLNQDGKRYIESNEFSHFATQARGINGQECSMECSLSPCESEDVISVCNISSKSSQKMSDDHDFYSMAKHQTQSPTSVFEDEQLGSTEIDKNNLKIWEDTLKTEASPPKVNGWDESNPGSERSHVCGLMTSRRTIDVECQTDKMNQPLEIQCSSMDVACQTTSILKKTLDAFTNTLNDHHVDQLVEAMPDVNLKALDLSFRRLPRNEDRYVKDGQDCDNALIVCPSYDCVKTCSVNSFLPGFNRYSQESSGIESKIHLSASDVGKETDKAQIINENQSFVLRPSDNSSVFDSYSVVSNIHRELNEQCLDEIGVVTNINSQESSLYESPLREFV